MKLITKNFNKKKMPHLPLLLLLFSCSRMASQLRRASTFLSETLGPCPILAKKGLKIVQGNSFYCYMSNINMSLTISYNWLYMKLGLYLSHMRENQINFCDYSTEINQLIPGKKKF